MANILLYANNATSTLLGNVGPTDTSFTVPNGDGAKFPSPVAGQSFLITVQDNSGNLEVMECTGRTNDVLTVIRGRDGTAARAFTVGATIEARVTAGMLSYLDWRSVANIAGGPSVLDVNGRILQAQIDVPVRAITDPVFQPKLGYTPVQQGGGPLQAANKTYLGMTAAGTNPRVAIDTTDFGEIVTKGIGAAETVLTYKTRFRAGSTDTTDRIVMGGTATGFGETFIQAGATTFEISNGGIGQILLHTYATHVTRINGSLNVNGTAVALSTSTWPTGQITGLDAALASKVSKTGDTITGNLTVTGTMTASTVTDTSDERTKVDVRPMSVADVEAIIRDTSVVRFFNKRTDREDFGVIAQAQLQVTPELVHVDAAGLHSVAYQRLAPIAIAGLQLLFARVNALEARVK